VPADPEPQWPPGVAHLVGALAVDHRPLVQTETPELGSAVGGAGEQVAYEGQRVAAGREVCRDIEFHAVIDDPVVPPLGTRVSGRASEPHTQPGVPPPDRRRRERVVGEDEVLHRMRYAACSPFAMTGSERVDPISMSRRGRPPLLLCQHLRHGTAA
jgi:hypothetical protein